jgi:hypothetical protein
LLPWTCLTDFVKDGLWDVSDVLKPLIEKFKKDTGLE